MGRLDEALAEAKRAVELDPLSAPISRDLGYAYYEARQYDQAIEQERKALELDPNFMQARSILGRAYVQKAMYDEGIAEFKKTLMISPGQPKRPCGPRARLCRRGPGTRSAGGARSIAHSTEAGVCCTKGTWPQSMQALGRRIRRSNGWKRLTRRVHRFGNRHEIIPGLRSAALGPALRRPAAPHEPAALAGA